MKKNQTPTPSEAPDTQPADHPAIQSKWAKSAPIFGARSVSEVVTDLQTGTKILVITDLTKGSKPRRFPLAAVDLAAMRRPPADESPETLEIMRLAADTGRVLLKTRQLQEQERDAQQQEFEQQA